MSIVTLKKIIDSDIKDCKTLMKKKLKIAFADILPKVKKQLSYQFTSFSLLDIDSKIFLCFQKNNLKIYRYTDLQTTKRAHQHKAQALLQVVWYNHQPRLHIYQ